MPSLARSVNDVKIVNGLETLGISVNQSMFLFALTEYTD